MRGGGEKAHTRSVKIRPEIGTVRTGQEGSARNREGWHGAGKVGTGQGRFRHRTENASTERKHHNKEALAHSPTVVCD